MTMKIGEMRHRLTFQRPIKTDDGYKGKIVQWQDVVTVWASIEPLTGREYLFAHQLRADITHQVKIRYREGFTTEMRAKLGERVLAIESIIDRKEEHKILEIFCREKK